MLNNGTTNEFITHVISDDGTLLHSGSDVDSRFSFFLNNTTLLRTFEKQVDVLEHKKSCLKLMNRRLKSSEGSKCKEVFKKKRGEVPDHAMKSYRASGGDPPLDGD